MSKPKEKLNIPEGWVQKKLDDFINDNHIELGRGNVISKSDIKNNPGDYPIYSSSVKGAGLFGSYGDYMFDEEMITWSVDGGGDFFYRPKHRFSVTNVSGFMRVDPGVFDYKYLAYHLQNEHSRKTFDYQSKAHPSVIRQEYVVNKPPLKEQQKIAGILEAVDSEIEQTKSVIKATEKLKKALMQELFTRGIGHTKFKQTELGEIPGSWSICPLNSIATVIDSLHKTPKFAEEGYAMVRVSDIKTGNLNLSTALKVPEEVYKEFTSNYIPKKGDLVLSRVGSYGVVSYVATEEKFCMGQNTVVINCDLNAKYVYFALNSDLIKNQIENQVAGSGYKSLSLKSIRELKVPVPVSGEELRISEVLSALDEKISINKKLLAKQTELKKGLMQDLLSGVKRVNI